MTDRPEHLDLATFRARLGEGEGPEYWRTLDELAQDPSFEEMLRLEFPREAAALGEGVDRRDFLRLMSASLAMGGLAACTPQAEETIVPYVNAPERIIPGKPLFYASAMEMDGVGLGVLVESHMGRPTKIEGNPEHPGSLGATDHFAQASILSLYDPDRSQTVRARGEVATWSAFVSALQSNLQPLRARGGEGLRILTEPVSSPTFADQMAKLRQRFPAAVWHTWQPVTGDDRRDGARLAFGRPVHTYHRFAEADVILSLDADFMMRGAGAVRYAREFADRRRVRKDKTEMNRLYVAEPMPTTTGTMADHRLAIQSAAIEELTRGIAAALGLGGEASSGQHATWIGAVARDLRAHAGRSLVIVGDSQPAAVHALAHAMNSALGNVGRTVFYTEPLEANPVPQMSSLRALVADMKAGRVEILMVLGGNPAFSAPYDFGFAAAMNRVPFRVHLSNYYDETSARSHWHIPAAQYLEAWSDVRAYDGTVSIVQPLIQPLYGGRSIHEMAGALSEDVRSGHDIVRDYWRETSGAGSGFEAFWNRSLHDGIVAGTAFPPLALSAGTLPPREEPERWGGPEVVLRPDPMIHDGRFANNAWLQELPKPITKLTWDNTAHVSRATAAAMGLSNGDVVEITAGHWSAEIPIWIVPGHANDSFTVYYGYGAERTGTIARGIGSNLQPLRTMGSGDLLRNASVRKSAKKMRLATVQEHHALSYEMSEGAGARRDIIRSGTISQYVANPRFADEPGHELEGGPSLYPPWPYPGNAWAMVIDTNVCTGCGICTIACQSENSIPVVGKEQVLAGREMHWIRTDHYYKGSPDSDALEMFNMPVPCMHCENAPCEPVCPVQATTHSDEGLNDMTYNRCIGTRYCSNNCPYKVRRFNFLSFPDYETESYKLMRNPDVTVRSRGVMEKCTYCVQRINAGRIEAEKEGRPIRDGEVVPACAQACPTRAIVFGNKNDENSEVARLRSEPLNYGLLTELNTQPRTTYLGSLKNPNPELAPAGAPATAGHAES
ncbi:MAG TPA: TAT-variant-translocated molybdopterin oxidoreductase [Thermoanaerobaculia bacterium]|nr:TAT-variant-translocated molybdopterin oxidoreductase [Thermoanaerobaculia bacterium]